MNEKLIFGTGASAAKNYEGLKKVVFTALENNIRFFDTAPSYGVEEILAKILFESGFKRDDFAVQTKIDAWQMMDGNIDAFVDGVLRKMNVQYIDNLLIHWPLPDYLEDTWDKFKKIKAAGKVRRIGICNPRSRHLKSYDAVGISPDIVQIERNPLRTCEREIAFCKQKEIEIQVYSPLCKMDKRLSESPIIHNISKKYDKSIGQIILRWHIDTGVVPIFTSTKEQRIREYTELFDFALDKDDVVAISSLNINYKYYLESCLCPGF